ncbi:MAG: thermonuclease family protein [bacterium]
MKLNTKTFVIVLLAGTAISYLYSTSLLRLNRNPSSTTPQTSNSGPIPQADTNTATTMSTNNGEGRDFISHTARVIEIHDGDSFRVLFTQNNQYATVRVKGIDCPEASSGIEKCGRGGVVDLPCEKQIPIARRASAFAEEQLLNKTVKLESYNNFNRGNDGRILAYVRSPNGKDYGLQTIKKGYCNDSGRIYDHPRDETYENYRRPLINQ